MQELKQMMRTIISVGTVRASLIYVFESVLNVKTAPAAKILVGTMVFLR